MKELYLLSDNIEGGYEIIEPRTLNKICVFKFIHNDRYFDCSGNLYEMIVSEEEDGTIVHHGIIKVN